MKADFQNLIVALDLSPMDEQLYQFANYFAARFEVKAVHFLHVIPELVLPDGEVEVVHNLFSPGFQLDEKVRRQLAANVKSKFKNPSQASVTVDVEEGSPFDLLAKKTNDAEVGLLLLGKKKISSGSGITAQMVARKVKSDICFVPEKSVLEFRHILVPMDFSAYSLRALQTAIAIRGDQQDVKITCMHVVDYTPTSLYLTHHYGLLTREWREKVMETFNDFFVKHQLTEEKLEPAVLQNDFFNIAEHIRQWAESNQVDLIVLGARGHSTLDDLFLGSVTEKLVTAEEDVPVLVVR